MSLSKRTPLEIQFAVWRALYVREMRTQFGQFRLGYLWTLIEPLSHILVLTFIFSFISRDAPGGMPFGIFFATGIVPYFLFQKIVVSSVNAIPSNNGLFSYRQVKPIDPVLARAFIELITSLATLVALMLIGAWFFSYDVLPNNVFSALGYIAAFTSIGIGFGLPCAVLGALWPEIGKFIPHIMRPLYFISGIMIPLSALPTPIHGYLLWNPLLHGIEMFRQACSADYPTGPVSSTYFIAASILSLFIGLLIFRVNRERILR